MRDLHRRRMLPTTAPLIPPRHDDEDAPTARRKPKVFDGRYLLLQELGKGGMGAVWIVYDTEEMRRVALKQILPEGQTDQSLRERFRREYRALGAVRHPGVPTLYRCGKAPDGTVYFTMELIRGETLHKLLQQAPLDPVQALSLGIDLGHILMAAHAVGIVHRDVKPGNIMIEPGGRVRLIDFGACLPLRDFYRREEVADPTATGVRWGTGEHEFIGTPAYTDPAAMREKHTTIRSDIYSVCTILYEAITGRARFDRVSHTLCAIQTAEFPTHLSRLAAELRRGTEREPARRHRSMAELVQTLEVLRSALLRERMQVSQPRPRLRRFAATTVALAVAAGVTLYNLRHSASDEVPSGEQVDSRLERREAAVPLPGDHCESLRGEQHALHPISLTLAAAEPAQGAIETTADLDLDTPATGEPVSDAGTQPIEPKTTTTTTANRKTSTIAAVLRQAQPVLRTCQPHAPLTVDIVVRNGRATARTIDDALPDAGDPLHRCVMAVLARLDFPGTRTPVFRTVAL